jgi:hypothetical protein
MAESDAVELEAEEEEDSVGEGGSEELGEMSREEGIEELAESMPECW